MKRYSDEEIIDIVSKYTHLKDFRTENLRLYNSLIARINGTGKAFMVDLIRGNGGAPKKLVKGPKTPYTGKKRGPKPKPKKQTLNVNGGRMPSTMFPSKIIDGQLHCGRCLKPAINQSLIRKNMCKRCANKCYSLTTNGRDLNPWNIRDPFINTTITHYEKTFHLDLHADDRLFNYLTLIGYAFIFKDIYDEVK
jgi:hypothetical protein